MARALIHDPSHCISSGKRYGFKMAVVLHIQVEAIVAK